MNTQNKKTALELSNEIRATLSKNKEEAIEWLVQLALKNDYQKYKINKTWRTLLTGNKVKRTTDDWELTKKLRNNEYITPEMVAERAEKVGAVDGKMWVDKSGWGDELEYKYEEMVEETERIDCYELEASKSNAGYYSRRNNEILLPNCIGEELAKVWKTKDVYGGKQFTGLRTLPSILSLLGKSDVKDIVKAEQQKQKLMSYLRQQRASNSTVKEFTEKLQQAVLSASKLGNVYDPNVAAALNLLLDNCSVSARVVEGRLSKLESK